MRIATLIRMGVRKPLLTKPNSATQFIPTLESLDERVVPATHTWTHGGTTNNWSEVANWDVGPPNSGDDIVILPRNDTMVQDIPSLIVAQIQFANTGSATLTLATPLGINPSQTAVPNISNTNGGTNTITGSSLMTVNLDCIFGVDNGTLTVVSPITGNQGVRKFGAGPLTFAQTSPNTYNGITIVVDGTLNLNTTGTNDSALSNAIFVGDGIGSAGTAVLNVNSSHQLRNTTFLSIDRDGRVNVTSSTVEDITTLNLNGGQLNIATNGIMQIQASGTISASGVAGSVIDGSGRLRLQSGTVTVNATDGVADTDLLISAAISENLAGAGLVVNGAGTVVLASPVANTYTGTTQVNQGTFLMNGAVSNWSLEMASTPGANAGLFYATSTGFSGTFFQSRDTSNNTVLATVWFPDTNRPTVAILQGRPVADRFDVSPFAGLQINIIGGTGVDEINLIAPTTLSSGAKFTSSQGFGGTYIVTNQMSNNANLGTIWFTNTNPPTNVRMFGLPAADDQFDVTPVPGVALNAVGNGGNDTLNVFAAPTTGGSGLRYAASYGFGGTYMSVLQKSNNASLGTVWFPDANPLFKVRLFGIAGSSDQFDIAPLPGTSLDIVGGGGSDTLNLLSPAVAASGGIHYATSFGFGGAFVSARRRSDNLFLGDVFFPGNGSVPAVQLYGTTAVDQFDLTPMVGTQYNLIGNGGADLVTANKPTGGVSWSSFPLSGGVFYTARGAGNSDLGSFWVFATPPMIVTLL